MRSSPSSSVAASAAARRSPGRRPRSRRCSPKSLVNCASILDRKSTRLNSSHSQISYAVFCLKKKKDNHQHRSPPHRLDERKIQLHQLLHTKRVKPALTQDHLLHRPPAPSTQLDTRHLHVKQG